MAQKPELAVSVAFELGQDWRLLRTVRWQAYLDLSEDFFCADHAPFRNRLEGGAQVVGVVEVVNHRGDGRFPESSLPLLDLFANLAASSTHNALAHASMAKERTAFRESVLAGNEIVGSSTTLAETINIVTALNSN